MLYGANYGHERANMEDRSPDCKKCHFFVSNSTHEIKLLVAMASIYYNEEPVKIHMKVISAT